MKKALVTGVAGFIGSHISERLVKEGYIVYGIDNESTGIRGNIPNEVNYYFGDIRNTEFVKEIFTIGFDLVCHLAGSASTVLSFSDPIYDLQNNVEGTINVINACLNNKVSRLLYASSMTCYGKPTKIPTTEEEPAKPISYYGITKYAAERYVMASALRNDLEHSLNVTAFRMFNVYGERQRLDNPYQGVLGYFIGNILRNEPITIHSDGEQTRDFVYIEDVVDAWILSIENPRSFGNVFNIGYGQSISINYLVDTLLKVLNKNRSSYEVKYAPERPGDQRNMTADITKAIKELQWRPHFPLLKGLEKTLNWARNQFEKKVN